MKVKWERNSRTLALATDGKIDYEDIIDRTTTDNFPAEAATVRMAQLSKKSPNVTVHIRGKSRQRPYWNGGTYECASTCRVNLGGEWQGKRNTAMDSNGELDEGLNWLDVHNIVTEVKEAMGI